MSKIAIITDSTADLPHDVIVEHGIYVVPLQVSFGERVYRDGIDIGATEFYHRLRTSQGLPTTSQPATGDFVNAYHKASQNADSIVSIHLSSQLSGTVDFAHTALAECTLPVPVHIIDSRQVSVAMGLVVLKAAELASKGCSAEEIVAHVQGLIPQVSGLFVVDTLEYLHRGGRIGGAEAFLGSLLSIKPLLQIANGGVEALEKTRTKQRAVSRLLDVVGDRIGTARHVRFIIAHADALQDAMQLKSEIETRFHHPVLHVCDLSPVVGVHAGPGMFGVAFYIEEQ